MSQLFHAFNEMSTFSKNKHFHYGLIIRFFLFLDVFVNNNVNYIGTAKTDTMKKKMLSTNKLSTKRNIYFMFNNFIKFKNKLNLSFSAVWALNKIV